MRAGVQRVREGVGCERERIGNRTGGTRAERKNVCGERLGGCGGKRSGKHLRRRYWT